MAGMRTLRKIALAVLLGLTGFIAVEGQARAARSSLAPSARSTTAVNDKTQASSDNRNLGLGLMLGDPSGLTMKYWLRHTTALQFGLSYFFGNYMMLMGDYLWHFPNAFKTSGVTIVPYAGIGALVAVTTDGADREFFGSNHASSAGLGVQIPLGVELRPLRVPLGIFAEFAPGLGLIPGMTGFVQGDLGIRIYL